MVLIAMAPEDLSLESSDCSFLQLVPFAVKDAFLDVSLLSPSLEELILLSSLFFSNCFFLEGKL